MKLQKKCANVVIGIIMLFFIFSTSWAGFVGNWTFDNCDGTDSSWNGNNGILVGDPQCVTGVLGHALALDGVSTAGDRVDLGASPDYNLAAFSICGRIYPFLNCGGSILYKVGSFGVGMNFGQLQGGIWINGGWWTQNHSHPGNPQPDIPSEEWTCFCITYGDGYMRFYIDGQEVNSYEQNHTPDESDDPLYIGHNGGAGVHYFEGIVDEMRLYDNVLTSGEVAAYCDGGCECADADSDGVPDAWDKCPDTSSGRPTDSSGCPKGGVVIMLGD